MKEEGVTTVKVGVTPNGTATTSLPAKSLTVPLKNLT